MNKLLISSPLEQFCIIPLFELNISFLNFYITNEAIFLAIFFLFVIIFFQSLYKPGTKSFYVIGNSSQYFFLKVYQIISDITSTTIGVKKGQQYIPLFFSLFLFIVGLNIFGLIPFSFSLTSQFSVTLSLSFMLFFGINFIGFRTYGLKMFELFFPSNTEFYVGILLTPIEIISYLFRPISLGLRLCINMIASHILIKIVAGLGWSLMKASGFLFFLHIVPLLILVPLLLLELFVSVLQGVIFVALTIVYLGDVLSIE